MDGDAQDWNGGNLGGTSASKALGFRGLRDIWVGRHVWLFATPWTPTRLFCPWNSPSKNIGVSNHSLLQGNLPDPGIDLWSPAQLVAHHRLEFLKRDPHWTWTWDQSLTPWGYSLLEGEREGVLLCDVERAFWHNYTSASLLSIPEHIHIETPIILSFEVHPGNCHCWYTGTLRCACYPCLHSPESSLSMHPWHHSTPCNKLQCPLILLFMIFKYWIFMETLQKMRRYFK